MIFDPTHVDCGLIYKLFNPPLYSCGLDCGSIEIFVSFHSILTTTLGYLYTLFYDIIIHYYYLPNKIQ